MDEYFKAVMSSDVEGVIRCLDQGIDPNTRDITGNTALHVAVYRGYSDIVRALVQRGADVNARIRSVESDKDPGGRTNWSVLQMAAVHDMAESARILLDHGADIEARDEYGSTALWDAMEPQNGVVSGPAVARLLVERGADISTGFVLGLYHEGDERFGRFDIIDELIRLCEATS